MVNQEELKMEIARIAEGADMLSVETRADYEALIKQDDMAANLIKQVKAYFGPDKKKASDLHKSICDKENTFVKPLEEFRKAASRATGAFLALEQKREQERLDAIRREAERIRKEQEARQAAEAEALRQKQEAERKAAEEAFKNSPEELAKAKARLEAEQAAQREAQARKAAEMIDTSLVPATAAKVSAGAGRSAVETWTYEVVDESLVPAAYKVLDLSKIKKQVQLTKDKTNIPGIRPYKTVETRRTGGGYGAD